MAETIEPNANLPLPLPRVPFSRTSTPRPIALDPESKLEAARALAREIAKFCNPRVSGPTQAVRIEELAKDIVAYSRSDGYEMAKALEDYARWHIDADMVEMLDGWSSLEHHALQKAIETWASGVEMTTLPIGTAVKQIEQGYCRRLTFGPPGLVGTIASVHGADWTYRVDVETGLPDLPSSRIIVAVEDMVPAEIEPSSQTLGSRSGG